MTQHSPTGQSSSKAKIETMKSAAIVVAESPAQLGDAVFEVIS